MLAAFSIAPTTTDDPDGSVAASVAEAIRIVRESGLPNETNAMCSKRTSTVAWVMHRPGSRS